MTKKCVKINYFNVVLMSTQCSALCSHSLLLSLSVCGTLSASVCVYVCVNAHFLKIHVITKVHML